MSKRNRPKNLRIFSEDYRDEQRQEMETAGIDFRALRDASAEERKAKMAQVADVNKKVNDKFQPKLAEILDKTQNGRLMRSTSRPQEPGYLTTRQWPKTST